MAAKQPARKGVEVTLKNYKRLRARFSPEQWKAYHEHLGQRETSGRAGLQNQVEAVDLTVNLLKV